MKTVTIFASLCLFSLGLALQPPPDSRDISSIELSQEEIQNDDYFSDDSEEVYPEVLVRKRRQSPRDHAMGLSLNHQNRKVGSVSDQNMILFKIFCYLYYFCCFKN